jgi:putative ABC transport system permease protein
MNELLNWFSQVIAVTAFSLRSIPERIGASLAAATGIAGVVAVFVGVLSIAEGFRHAMTVSGSPDVAVVLRSGSENEMTSGLSGDDVRLISDAPGAARDSSGVLASAELFVIINLPKRGTGTDASVPLRGVGRAAMPVRGNIRVVQGRNVEPGRNEIMVGAGAAREFAGLEVGKRLRLGRTEWDVVGLFTAGGGVAESEIWTDAAVLQPVYHRGDTFQADYVKLVSPEAFQEFKDALTANPRLNVSVIRQTQFNSDQSSTLTAFIRTVGILIASLMALGALFGAVNTMNSSVTARTREIATLRALGFGADPVVVAVMFEALTLSLVAGGIGAAGAYFAFNGFTASTINSQTFSQVTFAFAVTPKLLVAAILWAEAIGFAGGMLPAIRAARLPIAAALRDS